MVQKNAPRPAEDIIERSIARIPMYQALNTIKIDTNAKTVAMIANEIKQLQY